MSKGHIAVEAKKPKKGAEEKVVSVASLQANQEASESKNRVGNTVIKKHTIKIVEQKVVVKKKPKKAKEFKGSLKITLVKSPIGSLPAHIATVESLGLTTIGQTIIHPNNAATAGKVESILHLLKIEQLTAETPKKQHVSKVKARALKKQGISVEKHLADKAKVKPAKKK